MPPLRPSLGYVARNLMLDLEAQPDAEAVVATRITMDDDVRTMSEGMR